MFVTSTLALILAIGVNAATQGGSTTRQDETAIRELVKIYVDARDKGDEAAVRALFTDDADQLTSSGEWRRGREELVRGTLASSKANTGTRTITLETIRFPAAGVAIADGTYVIAGTGSTRNMWTSFVLVKSGTAWRISAIRNMLPAAAPR
jgi:uncharacterized protein (TIGR02246 family)